MDSRRHVDSQKQHRSKRRHREKEFLDTPKEGYPQVHTLENHRHTQKEHNGGRLSRIDQIALQPTLSGDNAYVQRWLVDTSAACAKEDYSNQDSSRAPKSKVDFMYHQVDAEHHH